MTTAIDPQNLVDILTTLDIGLRYNVDINETPDPNEIIIRINSTIGSGATGYTNEVLEIAFNDMPAGAQSAIQQLYTFCEAKHAEKYITP